MNLPNKAQKHLLLIWAFAIGWFYLGSLINFHQHHIWGKQMIPQVNSCSRNKSKTAPGYGNDETAGFHLPANDFISDTQTSFGFIFDEPNLEIAGAYCLLAHPVIQNNDGFAFSHLRGPPQA
jgi:hypothetical protein